jgi:hypothetical protein
MFLQAVVGNNRWNWSGGRGVGNETQHGGATAPGPRWSAHRDRDRARVQSIARRCGLDPVYVASVVEDAEHLVRDLVTDDGSIFAPPLMYTRVGDPVWDAVWRLFKARSLPEDLYTLEPPELAATLGLATEVVEQHPVYFELNLLSELAAIRTAYTNESLDDLGLVLFAWVDGFGRQADYPFGRPFEVPRVGSERQFAAWLEDHISVLAPFGYDLAPRVDPARQGGGRELAPGERRRPDRVYRVRHDDGPLRRGDRLVIESKTVMADVGALHGLRRCVDVERGEPAEGRERVFGLLIADGATVELQAALPEAGLGYLTLAALGYRDHLRGRAPLRDAEESPRLRHTLATGRGIHLLDGATAG